MRCREPGRLSDAAVAGIAGGTLALGQYQTELEHLDECERCQEWLESGIFAHDSSVDDFVASELLVARILQNSRGTRARPRFRMPPHLLEAAHLRERRIGLRGAAAVVLGGLGLTPAALAAAVFLNLVALGALGVWAGSPLRLRYVVSAARPKPSVERVFFVPLGTPAGRIAADTTTRLGRARTRADSIRIAAELRTRDSVFAAVNRDVYFAPAQDSIAPADTLVLARAAAMLRRVRSQRIRVTGESSAGTSDVQRTASGRALAQRIGDFFATRGVGANRLSVVGAPWSPQMCGARSTACAGKVARVTIRAMP